MTTAQTLLRAQSARLSALDPELPDEHPLPRRGEPIMARIGGGEAGAGLAARTSNPPGTLQSHTSADVTIRLETDLNQDPWNGAYGIVSMEVVPLNQQCDPVATGCTNTDGSFTCT